MIRLPPAGRGGAVFMFAAGITAATCGSPLAGQPGRREVVFV